MDCCSKLPDQPAARGRCQERAYEPWEGVRGPRSPIRTTIARRLPKIAKIAKIARAGQGAIFGGRGCSVGLAAERLAVAAECKSPSANCVACWRGWPRGLDGGAIPSRWAVVAAQASDPDRRTVTPARGACAPVQGKGEGANSAGSGSPAERRGRSRRARGGAGRRGSPASR
jgi:hypothetical protein